MTETDSGAFLRFALMVTTRCPTVLKEKQRRHKRKTAGPQHKTTRNQNPKKHRQRENEHSGKLSGEAAHCCNSTRAANSFESVGCHWPHTHTGSDNNNQHSQHKPTRTVCRKNMVHHGRVLPTRTLRCGSRHIDAVTWTRITFGESEIVRATLTTNVRVRRLSTIACHTHAPAA